MVYASYSEQLGMFPLHFGVYVMVLSRKGMAYIKFSLIYNFSAWAICEGDYLFLFGDLITE